MRLTLRTLLAYLDDTLPPGEIRAIGQKVAESDTAQELIERIKQVTRRRRLTTPPTSGAGALDANTTAEYLDNELSSEQVAELEKLAIESDVHLAELAACHQILTLVLGEPAQVPPTARERMYGLVQGRESLTSRRAPRPQTASSEGPDQEADENLLPGLSIFHHAPWLRWALPVAGAILLLVIGIGLGKLLFPGATPDKNPNDGNVAQNTLPADTNADKLAAEKAAADKAAADKAAVDKAAADKAAADKAAADKAAADKAASNKHPDESSTPPREAARIQTPPPPTRDRVKLGRYQAYERTPSILVARDARDAAHPGDWQRVLEGGDIYSSDQLLSLPGYASEINLPNGGQVLMRGLIPEMSRNPITETLLESVVTLHTHPDTVDVDLTLNRGRIYLINNKDQGPLNVRLRLATEVWDLVLKEPGTEVGIDLDKRYSGYIRYINWQDEEPLIQVVLEVLKGTVSLKLDADVFPNMEPPPGTNYYTWNNKRPSNRKPGKTPEEAIGILRKIWDKQPAIKSVTRDVEFAPAELSAQMGPKKAPGPALSEAFASDSRGKRIMAIYAFGALDLSNKLIDVLGDGDEAHEYERYAAWFAFRCWLTHSLETSKILFDPGTKMGEFVQKGYTPEEARNMVALLHDFPADDARKLETFQDLRLRMDDRNRVAVRELAWRQMQILSRPADPLVQPVKLPVFNAAWSEQMRKPALDEIDKLMREGKLPPVRPAGPDQPR